MRLSSGSVRCEGPGGRCTWGWEARFNTSPDATVAAPGDCRQDQLLSPLVTRVCCSCDAITPPHGITRCPSPPPPKGECRQDEFFFSGHPGEAFASIDKALDERTIGHNPERINLMKVGAGGCRGA